MEKLIEKYEELGLQQWYKTLEKIIREKRDFLNHTKGNFLRFQGVIKKIPKFLPSHIDLDTDKIQIGRPQDLSEHEANLLHENLTLLCPWRKGPFNFFGIDVDTEWLSSMKWERLKGHISSLEGKRILDIGSSNGYYMFRMAAQNPRMVLGLEPQSSFYCQYLALQKFLNLDSIFCLPIPFGELPLMKKYFDSIFCMGILYHRRSPMDMLKTTCDLLKEGGQIIVENLVIDSRENQCLFPKDRYAKMRNVFFIPDISAMESWLTRAGFTNVRCVDVTRTTSKEQRKTKWIQTETLTDFLDPDDPSKTIEGYPAPVRGIFVANAT
ncbi:MAG: tRNA 5-methoxyuridine(34)/uridine 5-oxyacetic acid(34) synthase CmoB [Desulfobacteraceae bacterium]|nr:tRNA 5-methoxyuridine(34)/uridine 5-oxyacetic acid(34) synthase CmoB [Desulfobacteraceae bacterium]